MSDISIYKKLKLNFFLKEAIIFISIVVVGIFASIRLNKIIGSLPPLNFEIKKFDFTDFVIFFIFGFLFFYALLKPSRFSYYFLQIFYLLTIFAGIQLVLSLFIDNYLATVSAISLIVLGILYRSIFFHNFNFAFAISGLSLVLAARLESIIAVIILILFSLYDIIAVYFTKHMVKMAHSMIEQRVIFGFIIPSKSSYLIKPPEEFEIGTKESEVFILGGGDIALPLLLIFSLTKVSLFVASFVAVFSLLGIFLTHLIFALQTERKPMAALPPIATMTILGYLITFLF